MVELVVNIIFYFLFGVLFVWDMGFDYKKYKIATFLVILFYPIIVLLGLIYVLLQLPILGYKALRKKKAE